MIRAVLFDIDDTLIDHSSAMRDATAELHKVAGGRLSFGAFKATWQAAHARHYPRFLRAEMSYAETVRARVREAIDPQLSDEAVDSLFEEYLAHYERGWRLFDDVLECLNALGFFQLGIVSNGRSDEQRRKLDKLALRPYFNHVIVSEDIAIAKPRSEIFHRACQALRLPPCETAYVGDNYELDAKASRDAGLQGIWLNRRQASKADDDTVLAIETLRDLPKLLQG